MKLSRERFKSGLRRGMWLFMALLFIASGVGISAAIFWQFAQQDDQNQTKTTNQLRGKPLAGFAPVAEVGTLQKIDQKVGDGNEAKIGSTVTVVYTGAVAATGIVFDSSLDRGQPAQFVLQGPPEGLIEGWAQGMPGMKVGGQRRLLIPVELAYGASPPPSSNIPPNAALVFDITLLAVE